MSGRFILTVFSIALRKHPNQSTISQSKTCSFQTRRGNSFYFQSLASLALSRRAPSGPLAVQNTGLASRIGSDSNRPPPRAFRGPATTPRSRRQFVEQRLCIFQIERVEAFSEPAVDRSQ